MSEAGNAHKFLDEFPKSPRAEERLFRRIVVISIFFHVLITALVPTWTGRQEKIPPPVRVLFIELETAAPSEPKLVPPVRVNRQKTEPVRRVSPGHPARPVSPPPPSAVKPQPSITPAAIETPRRAPAETPANQWPEDTIVRQDVVRSSPPPPQATAGKEASDILPTRPSANAAPLAAYMKVCRQLIEKHKEYPEMARKIRKEGTVLIHVVLKQDGSLAQSGVAKSSGHSLLDKAALRAVESVGTFPPLPPELNRDELVFEVPISFKLSID
jgi:protein TonB